MAGRTRVRAKTTIQRTKPWSDGRKNGRRRPITQIPVILFFVLFVCVETHTGERAVDHISNRVKHEVMSQSSSDGSSGSGSIVVVVVVKEITVVVKVEK